MNMTHRHPVDLPWHSRPRHAARAQRILQVTFCYLTCLSAVMLLLSESMRPAAANENEPAVRDEASLLAVTFIDPDRGWAVGERGTVLHTDDGGVHWSSQPSPTQRTLTDIAMYNSQRGLAIGGTYRDHTQLSVGEILITKDGGETWIANSNHDLPRLRKLLIGPGGKCVAVGDWSPIHLSSVFASVDGGQSWQPQACDIAGCTIDIAGSTDDFLVLSDRGEVVRFRPDAEPRQLFSAGGDWQQLSGRQSDRLLTGENSAILSRDNGDTWHVISELDGGPDPTASGEATDAILGEDEIWVAKEWSMSITAVRNGAAEIVPHLGDASVHSLVRLDRDRGWAVGDFGLVLGTRDGGKSWRTLRGGGRSAAILFVGMREASLPWSLIAQESFQHHRRIAIVIDRARDEMSTRQLECLKDVTAAIGPVISYATNSSPPGIANLLQTMRPAVIVLDQAMSSTQRELWTTQAVQAGVRRVLEVGERGTQTVHVAAAIPAVGILASDVWCDAIAKLAPGALPPTKLLLSPRADSTSDSLAGDGLASCVANDSRYSWSRSASASRRQLQVLQARSAELTWIDSLVTGARSREQFKQLLEPVLQRMSREDRQQMFTRLIGLTASQGRQDLYVATLELLIEPSGNRATNEPLAESDLLRLGSLRLSAIRTSPEWRQTFGNAVMRLLPSDPTVSQEPSSINLAVQWSPFQSPTSPSPTETGSIQAGGFVSEREFGANGLQLASGQMTGPKSAPRGQAIPVDLRWEFHPAVLIVGRATQQDAQGRLLPLNPAAPRGRLPVDESRNAGTANLRRLLGQVASGRWATLATDAVTAETIRCPLAVTQPYLDSSFDELWWQPGRSFGSESDAITVQMAHDKDFVYLAIDAARLDTAANASEVRQRDTPLDLSDRYRIRIDRNRDLLTAYEFEFDGNGHTRDSCDGFIQFQPRWFISCKQIANRTRAEIAIQKADLGENIAAPGEIWNVSLDRLNRKMPARGLAMPDPESWRPALLE